MTTTILSTTKKALILAALSILTYTLAVAGSGITMNQLIGSNATITGKDVTEKAIWVGTNEGLYKINKSDLSVQKYTTENSQLPSNHITGICTNSDDNVFVATDKGILRYDGYAFMIINTENANLPTDKITAIACDGADNLWLGTQTGLVMMKGYKTKVYNNQNCVMTSNTVVSLKANGMISITVTTADNRQVEITNQGMQLMEVEAAADIVASKN